MLELGLHLQISWSRLVQRGSIVPWQLDAKAGTVQRACHMTGTMALTMRLGRLDHNYSWLLNGATVRPGSVYVTSHVLSSMRSSLVDRLTLFMLQHTCCDHAYMPLIG
jgi:hypothetical protein